MMKKCSVELKKEISIIKKYKKEFQLKDFGTNNNHNHAFLDKVKRRFNE
jgi:hypothetical protein